MDPYLNPETPESAEVVQSLQSVVQTEAQARSDGTAFWSDPERVKVVRWLAATILVVILLRILTVSTYSENPSRNEQYSKSYEVWGVFHYYLGAKYFPEVGYFHLYTCALEADHESGGYWTWILGARDLQTYQMVPKAGLPPCPRTNFTAQRWSEFSQDVEYFARKAPPTYFARLFTDKGFNPPPSWVALASPLARVLPISSGQVADIVFNLDLIAVFIGVLIIWRSQGGACALLIATLTVFYFGNFGQIGGNFLQYFWFPFLVAAAAFWISRRPGLSGAMLGVATGLQSFPIFFGLPIVTRGVIDLFRGRKADARPQFTFTAAFVAVIVTSVFLGSLTGKGIGVWTEWQKKISIHKNYLRGEIFDVGLANFTAVAGSTNHAEATAYPDDILNTFARLDSFKSNKLIYHILGAVFLATWVLAVVQGPADDLFGHGFLLMYVVVSLSPYYYLSLVLLPFMFWKSDRTLRLYATFGTPALFVTQAILFPKIFVFRGTFVSFLYWPHLLSAWSIFLFFLGFGAISFSSYRSVGDAHPS